MHGDQPNLYMYMYFLKFSLIIVLSRLPFVRMALPECYLFKKSLVLGDSSQDEAEDDAKPVTVKYARPESEVAKARRLGSYEYLHKKHEEEPWVPLRYHNIHVSV